ncbi:MAG: tRNA 2-thiouridine(34) synthase MnmA [Hyphomicrobiales bacterium]|nr:tRNA 2-thiouridine(34) synthase MnmA [Hyphomicrobiales bacterium]
MPAVSTVPLPDAPPRGALVVVAMSGGVDSSLVAALLHRRGCRVVGVTLQLYDHGAAVGRSGSCCAGQDIHDARRVADHIGIPHYVLDYESRFRANVIEPFAQSYIDGETPVPCVSCNSTVKFSDLLGFAASLGADHLATGHYVERRVGPSGPTLHRGRDEDRDQSWFLFNTTRAQLERLVFPLGGLTKKDVRALASELGLPVAAKPDSQDICFVPRGRYSDVIARLRPEAAEPGDIVHIDGRVLGRHRGIVHYTIGQRRGLGLPSTDALHVVRLDPATAQVIVGPRSALELDVIELRGLNWLADEPVTTFAEQDITVYARLRSSHTPAPARLGVDGDRTVVILDDLEHGIAPGQACVLYRDRGPSAEVLGGGFIARTHAGRRRPGQARPHQRVPASVNDN